MASLLIATTWEVSYDYGAHMTKTVTVKAGSEEEARAKVEKAAEKKGMSIMINSVEPKEQGVAEDSEERIKFRGTDHDIGEERYRFVINGDTIFFNFPSDEDNPDPDSPSFEEILARVQRSGEVRHYQITPEEQMLIAKKIEAERQKYLDQRREGV